MNNVQEILAHWPVIFSGFGDNSLIAGSPNRTENRFLFHDEEGIFYIAEGYPPRKQQYQIRQNRLLEFLAENLVPGIHPFYRTLSGEHGVLSGGLFWQIKPYIEAEKIPRETLGERADFGRLWADFLLQMKTVVDRSMESPPMPEQPFFMADFLPVLQRHAERKMPEITDRLQEIAQRLIPFFKWERKADLTLAHGDFHPGNILMGQGMIRVVIDWEFAGAKFPGYDMALLIGCLAMDHPDNLFSPAVCALRNTLYANRYLPDDAWERLPQMIAATRLGWLGEWLTLEDKALVAQELELISILLDGDFAEESTLKG